jgi:hypothetical protein
MAGIGGHSSNRGGPEIRGPLPSKQRLGCNEWRPAFGLYWSPREWSLLQRLGLMELNTTLTGNQAREILFCYRSMSADTAWRAMFVGWIAGLLFGAFVL